MIYLLETNVLVSRLLSVMVTCTVNLEIFVGKNISYLDKTSRIERTKVCAVIKPEYCQCVQTSYSLSTLRRLFTQILVWNFPHEHVQKYSRKIVHIAEGTN